MCREAPTLRSRLCSCRSVARGFSVALKRSLCVHVPTAPNRGRDVFLPVFEYPHEEWTRACLTDHGSQVISAARESAPA
jgi:hypothetical protein